MTYYQLFSYFVIYVIIFSVVLFMCLPLFNPMPPKKIQKGHANSAPERPQLGKKFLLAAILSFLLLLLLIILVRIGILPKLEDFNR